MNANCEELQNALEIAENTVISRDKEIAILNTIISSRDSEIEALKEIINFRDADIASLVDMLNKANFEEKENEQEPITEDSTDLYDPNEIVRQRQLEIMWDQLLELRTERDKHAECRKKPLEIVRSTLCRTDEERIKMEEHLKKYPLPEIDWSNYLRPFTEEERETDEYYASEIKETEANYYKLKNSPRGSTLSNTGQSVLTPKQKEQNRIRQRAYQARKKEEQLSTGEVRIITEEERAKNRERQKRFRERQKQKQA